MPFYIDYDQHDKSEHIPFIRVSDARNGLLNFKKTVFLSYQLLKDINNIKIAKPKDLVITKGGEYIGETTLIPNTLKNMRLVVIYYCLELTIRLYQANI